MSAVSARRRIVSIIVAVAAIGGMVGYAAYLNGWSLDYSDTDALIVVSGSMDGESRDQYGIPTIPTGSLILIHEDVDYPSLRVGDVLTFDYVHPVSHESMVVTHRIIGISESDGVYTYTLKGDSIADDPTNGSVQVVTSDSGDIMGEVVGVSWWLGALVRFLSTWTGKAVLILIPCLVLIVSEVRNIYTILRKGGEEDESDAEASSEPAGTSAGLLGTIRSRIPRPSLPAGAAEAPAPSAGSEDSGPGGPVFMHRKEVEQ